MGNIHTKKNPQKKNKKTNKKTKKPKKKNSLDRPKKRMKV